MKLQDNVAIVTGSSQDIGADIALKFAESGANVIVNYRQNEKMAEALAAKIRNMGRKALTVGADVSKVADVNRMVQEAVDRFSTIDILVNNTGIFIGGEIAELTEEVWDRVMAVNLKGIFLWKKSLTSCMTYTMHSNVKPRNIKRMRPAERAVPIAARMQAASI